MLLVLVLVLHLVVLLLGVPEGVLKVRVDLHGVLIHQLVLHGHVLLLVLHYHALLADALLELPIDATLVLQLVFHLSRLVWRSVILTKVLKSAVLLHVNVSKLLLLLQDSLAELSKSEAVLRLFFLVFGRGVAVVLDERRLLLFLLRVQNYRVGFLTALQLALRHSAFAVYPLAAKFVELLVDHDAVSRSFVVEGHKSEAPSFFGAAVLHHHQVADVTVILEVVTELALTQVCRQPSNENLASTRLVLLLCHGVLVLLFVAKEVLGSRRMVKSSRRTFFDDDRLVLVRGQKSSEVFLEG